MGTGDLVYQPHFKNELDMRPVLLRRAQGNGGREFVLQTPWISPFEDLKRLLCLDLWVPPNPSFLLSTGSDDFFAEETGTTTGDTVNIRFNPAKPSEYYLPGLIQSALSHAWQLALYRRMLIILGIGFVIWHSLSVSGAANFWTVETPAL